MIKYYNILLIDNCKEESFLDKVKLNILKNMLIKSNINVMVDSFNNIDVNIKRYDLAIFNLSSKAEQKQYNEIKSKLIEYDIPIVYLGEFNELNCDDLKEILENKNHEELLKKNIISDIKYKNIGVSGYFTKDMLHIDEKAIIGNMLMNTGKVFRYKSAYNKLEKFSNEQEYILVNYSSLNIIKKENEQWVHEQTEILIQILLNKGHKIIITSLDGEEKQSNVLVNRFQNKNIKFVSCLNIYNLLELIKKSKMVLELGTEMSIITAGLNKPFLSIGYDIDYLDLKSLIDVDYMFLSIYELNVGKALKYMERVNSSYDHIIEKLENINEKYFSKYIEFVQSVFRDLEPKEKTIADSKYKRSISELNNKNIDIKKLHIGCGRNILDGWVNLDIFKMQGVDVVADLDDCKNTPLPFEENVFDEFYASHVIEHIKNPLPMLQELYRIAKPNSKAIFRCPYGSSDEAFENPTHVRQYFINSFAYFSQPSYWRADCDYRGDWQVEKLILSVDQDKYQGVSPDEILEDVNKYRNIVKEMIVELKAIKPMREAKMELQKEIIVEFELR